jgi:polysaccharide deacetylase family protein (PEP-CTERM system associated)
VTTVLNAFTVDVEDYYQVSAFERDIERSAWGSLESRVVANTQRLLEVLARHNTLGTFFVLGWVADKFPALVREIATAGHELGSHSYWHRLVYEMTPAEFREDLRRSIGVIEAAAGVRVNRYRAPSFSITARSLWALDILVEEGIAVDSSIFPVRHDRYGIPDADPRIHVRQTSLGPITEFPPTVADLGGFRLPVGGGGYFRLYPLAFTAHCLRQINAKRQPFMFYIHPWEIDPKQPRLRHARPVARMRHYVGLWRTQRRLEKLLASFRFGTMQATVDATAVIPFAAGPSSGQTHSPPATSIVEASNLAT